MGWLIAIAALGAALIVAYVTVLRFDLSMVPLAVGTMTAAGALARGAGRAYPGALAGAVLGALLAFAIGWWLVQRRAQSARGRRCRDAGDAGAARSV